MRENAIALLGIRAWKTKAKEDPGGNALRRLRLLLGCNATAAAVAVVC